jgi:predicted DNA-binding transcriptional regulator AlpA
MLRLLAINAIQPSNLTTTQAITRIARKIALIASQVATIGSSGMKSKTEGKPVPLPNTSQVAEFLGLPVRTLTQWRYHGLGPRYHKVGKHVRYRWSEVEAWLDDQGRDGSRVA